MTTTTMRSVGMDDIALALNPPRFVKRRQRPINLARSPSRVWPLAAINGRAPVVLDPISPRQRGVELAYPRMAPDDAISCCPIGSPNGTATHILPAMTAALAIDGGVITFAGRLGHGFGMITVNFQTRNKETTTPKGRTRRTIPMTTRLHDALKRMSVIREGLVVRNLDGSAKTDDQVDKAMGGSAGELACRFGCSIR